MLTQQHWWGDITVYCCSRAHIYLKSSCETVSENQHIMKLTTTSCNNKLVSLLKCKEQNKPVIMDFSFSFWWLSWLSGAAACCTPGSHLPISSRAFIHQCLLFVFPSVCAASTSAKRGHSTSASDIYLTAPFHYPMSQCLLNNQTVTKTKPFTVHHWDVTYMELLPDLLVLLARNFCQHHNWYFPFALPPNNMVSSTVTEYSKNFIFSI